MKVNQLLKLLEKADPKADVILSSDQEGNSFHLLSGVESEGLGYRKDLGEIEVTQLSDEEMVSKCKACIVLWP
jgi:hypothetical protein